jgi:hypothetical protein
MRAAARRAIVSAGAAAPSSASSHARSSCGVCIASGVLAKPLPSHRPSGASKADIAGAERHTPVYSR